MSFFQSIRSCMLKSFDFDGRASRSEFWWFVLALSILHSALFNIFNQPTDGFSFHFGFSINLDLNASWWSNIYTAVFGLAFVSAFVRRAHDVGVGGDKVVASLFVALVAFTLILKASPTQNTQTWLHIIILGAMLLGFFFITLKKSQPQSNRFGPNPNEVPS